MRRKSNIVLDGNGVPHVPQYMKKNEHNQNNFEHSAKICEKNAVLLQLKRSKIYCQKSIVPVYTLHDSLNAFVPLFTGILALSNLDRVLEPLEEVIRSPIIVTVLPILNRPPSELFQLRPQPTAISSSVRQRYPFSSEMKTEIIIPALCNKHVIILDAPLSTFIVVGLAMEGGFILKQHYGLSKNFSSWCV